MPLTSLGNSGTNGKNTALPIDLTGVEVIFLSDSLRNDGASIDEVDTEEVTPLYRDLLLRLGSAYCELVQVDAVNVGPVTVHITEEMTWLLRSKVRTGDVAIDGRTQIGHVLLLKLYNLLLQFNTAFADYKPAAEPEIDDSITRLSEWKKNQGPFNGYAVFHPTEEQTDATPPTSSPDTDYADY